MKKVKMSANDVFPEWGAIAEMYCDSSLLVVQTHDVNGVYYELYANSEINDPSNAIGAFNTLEDVRDFLANQFFVGE